MTAFWARLTAAAFLSRASLAVAAPTGAAPFPVPVCVPRVLVEVGRAHVLIVEDVVLGRGEWTGDTDAFVAFGAPGMPRALDAQLGPVGADGEEIRGGGESVFVERAPRRPGHASLLLGDPAMAGAVLHLREGQLRRAAAPTGLARVRLRTLLDLPAVSASGMREVVVRLGARDGEPLALGGVVLTSADPGMITSASAHLCGPEADARPLEVGARPSSPSAVAALLSVRHASDSLCIGFVTGDATKTR